MNGDAAQWDSLFPSEEIAVILAAVLRCAARLRKKHATEHENKLSDRLHKLLRCDPELRQSPVYIDREASIYHDGDVKEGAAGRVDFRFLLLKPIRPVLYFAAEAKRLHVTMPSGWASLVPEYVTGDQGMSCFITERYTPGLASGLMIGYVYDVDVDKARAAVAASIARNASSLAVEPHSVMTASVLIPAASSIYETLHTVARRRFVIYHIFCAV